MVKILLTFSLISINSIFSILCASESSLFEDEKLDHSYSIKDLDYQVEILPSQHLNNENNDHIALFNYDVNIDQIVVDHRKKKRTREEIISDEEDFVKHYLKKQKTTIGQLRSLVPPDYKYNYNSPYAYF